MQKPTEKPLKCYCVLRYSTDWSWTFTVVSKIFIGNILITLWLSYLLQAIEMFQNKNFANSLRSIVEGHKCPCMNPRYVEITIQESWDMLSTLQSKFTPNCTVQEQPRNWDKGRVSCQFESRVLYLRYPTLAMRITLFWSHPGDA